MAINQYYAERTFPAFHKVYEEKRQKEKQVIRSCQMHWGMFNDRRSTETEARTS